MSGTGRGGEGRRARVKEKEREGRPEGRWGKEKRIQRNGQNRRQKEIRWGKGEVRKSSQR